MRRTTARLGAAIVVLLVVGVAAALHVRGLEDGSDSQTLQTTGAARSAFSGPEPPVNLLPPVAVPLPPPPPELVTATTTTTTQPAPASTSTTAPPITTMTTTTTVPGPPPARTIAIAPTSGPGNTPITATGTGCVGHDAGVSIEQYDQNGTPVTGDGAAARPDGTWSQPISVNGPPGPYTLRGKCRVGATVLFEYEPLIFTVTP